MWVEKTEAVHFRQMFVLLWRRLPGKAVNTHSELQEAQGTEEGYALGDSMVTANVY